MPVKLLRHIFALLVVTAYIGATVVAAASTIGSCPALDGAPHTHGHHDHQHHHSSDKSAGECLKCCLGTCLVAPCLPSPMIAASERAFDGTPVLYWAVSRAIYGRAVAPDPGPPKPIA
jgi:hypothetical protein